MTKTEFIKKLDAEYAMAVKKGAKINKAVMFAQACHESNWGQSGLCVKANNLFGIKATSAWKGKTIPITGFEEVNGKNQYSKMMWRVYPSLADCIYNYSQIINLNSYYWDAPRKHLNEPDKYLGVIAKSWATDTRYASKVKAVGLEVQKLGGPGWC